MPEDESQSSRLALAMATGLHDRCGRDSPIHHLSPSIIQHISHYLPRIEVSKGRDGDTAYIRKYYGSSPDLIAWLDARPVRRWRTRDWLKEYARHKLYVMITFWLTSVISAWPIARCVKLYLPPWHPFVQLCLNMLITFPSAAIVGGLIHLLIFGILEGTVALAHFLFPRYDKVYSLSRVRHVSPRKGLQLPRLPRPHPCSLSIDDPRSPTDMYQLDYTVTAHGNRRTGGHFNSTYHVGDSKGIRWSYGTSLRSSSILIMIVPDFASVMATGQLMDGRTAQEIVVDGMRDLRRKILSSGGNVDAFDEIDCDINVIRSIMGTDLFDTMLKIQNATGSTHADDSEIVKRILYDS
jgi:hypothetical protein